MVNVSLPAPDVPHETPFRAVIAGSHGPLSDACRLLQSIVFSESYGDCQDFLHSDYAAYENSSRFAAVIDMRSGRLAGCVRILSGERPGDLITLRDALTGAQEHDIQKCHVNFSVNAAQDLRLLAVSPEYRRRSYADSLTPKELHPYMGVGVMVYRAAYMYAAVSGVAHWVMTVDRKAKRILEKLGFPIDPLCELPPRPYQGSEEAYPSYIHVPSMAAAMDRINPIAERVLCHGLGIDDICSFEVGNIR
jgi:GNAT superfamily N-acetyltransferase